MTTITIVTLAACLVWCWYIILKKQERLNANFETETRLEKELLRTSTKNDVLREENRHLTNLCKKLEEQREENHNHLKSASEKIMELCKREDKLITQWADSTCERSIRISSIFSPNTINVKEYMMYGIDGIEIKTHIGTASEMWELYNSSKEVYTKREEAKANLRKRVEEALAYEEVTEESTEVE